MALYEIKAGDKSKQISGAGNALTFSFGGDQIILEEGARISTTGTGNGINGSSSIATATMTLDGTVASYGGTAISTVTAVRRSRSDRPGSFLRTRMRFSWVLRMGRAATRSPATA